MNAINLEEKTKLLDRYFSYRKRFYQERTDYLHVDVKNNHHALLIPLYENIIDVLAHLRLHKLEELQPAKEKLIKLMHFFRFNEEEVFAPVFLHEYPDSSHKSYLFVLTAPLALIYTHYAHLFDERLKMQLQELLDKINDCLNALIEKHNMPMHLLIRAKCFSNALNHGVELPNIDSLSVVSSYEANELFISAQLLLNTSHHEWAFTLIEKLGALWHPRMLCFKGPIIDEYFIGYDEKPSLICSLFDEKDTLACLHLPLVFALPSLQEEISCLTYKYKTFTFTCESTNDLCLSFVNEYETPFFPISKGFELVRITQKNSLSITPPSAKAHVNFKAHQLTIDLFDISEDKEVIAIYLSDTAKVFIDGQKASCFQQSEKVQLLGEGFAWEMSFSGEGLMGHIAFGSRPSQLVKDLTRSFDWKIYLRNIKNQPIHQARLSLINL